MSTQEKTGKKTLDIIINPKVLGKEFFNSAFDTKKAQSFLDAFIDSCDLNGLFDAMQYAPVRVGLGAKSFVTNALGINDLDSGFFNAFVDLSNSIKLDKEKIFKVAVQCFNAQESQKIARWARGSYGYIFDQAHKDFYGVCKMLKHLDTSYKTFAILFNVDAKSTGDYLLNEILYEKNVDKVALRRLLLSYRVDVNYMFGDSFKDNDTKTRLAIVRLALVYKNEPVASRFLKRVAIEDPNSAIRQLADPSLKLVNEKTFACVKEELNFAIATGESTNAKEFTHRLATDTEFKKLAEDLFFCVYKNDQLIEVVVVQDDKVTDLENQGFKLDDSYTIKLLHPVEIPTSAAFIKTLNIRQPLLQLERPSFFVDANECRANIINRLPDTMVSLESFNFAVKRHGFKFICLKEGANLEHVVVSLCGIACVLRFELPVLASQNRVVTLKGARFYKESDFVSIRGKQYLEGARPMQIAEVPRRIFSELVYLLMKVGGVYP